MRPTQVLQGASRLPLTAKRGNKDFYKGTGKYPGLYPKAKGHHGVRSKAKYILEKDRLIKFVPPALNLEQSQLRPYVSLNITPHEYFSRVADPYPLWPYAEAKSEDESAETVTDRQRQKKIALARRGKESKGYNDGYYDPALSEGRKFEKFDGRYYIRLFNHLERTAADRADLDAITSEQQSSSKSGWRRFLPGGR